MTKNRQIDAVFTFFEALGTKNTVNTKVLAPWKPKTTVFTMCFAFGSKNHGIYGVV